MLREEAVHIVDVAFNIPQAVRRIGEDKTYHEDEIREAKRMAIKALEQIPDLKEAYNKGYKDGQDALAVHLELCKEEAEPCEDCISRKAVLDGIEELKKSPWATDKRGIGFEYLITEALEVVADLCVKREPPVTPKTDVLDKIRAEIHSTAEMHEDGDYYLRDEWVDEIIDKYKAESEDKE